MGNGKHEAWQALKFTLFSASAGIIQIITYTLMYEVLHWAPWLSYLVSLILSVLCTWWTAALTGENPFTGAAASGEPLVNNYVVQIGTMLINFVTEFLYQKFVVYRGTIDTNERARKQQDKEA